MVPEVHYGVIEEVLQRPVGDVDVRMVQVPDSDGDVEHDEGLGRGKAADEHDSDVLHGCVEHVLHPVVAQVRREAHLFHTMVDLVEAPKEFIPVQHHMGEPLNEVRCDEEDQQLCPAGHGAQVQQMHLLDGGAEQVVHSHVHHLAEGDEDDQVEDVEVEEHVEGIQPEILADRLLVLTPWKGQFKPPNEQGEQYEPVEIVHVPRIGVEGDLAPHVVSVVAERVKKSVEVTVHRSIAQ